MKSDISFNLPLEIDISKSGNGDERRIRGFASNEFKDRQEETLVQQGLDITNFVDYGWFNYDHDNTKILGFPDKSKTKVLPQGFYVEGTLLKGIPLADRIWELAVSLKKSGAPRKLGFSVEGKILQKSTDGKITKAKIYNVAITPNPVNPTATWDAVVKSFSSGEPCDGMFNGTTEVTGGEQCGALAGNQVNIGEVNSGSSLKIESLDTSLCNLAELLENTEHAQENLKKLKCALSKKSLSVNETILYLQLAKGLSRTQAMQIVKKINM